MSGTLKKPTILAGSTNPNFPVGFNREEPDGGAPKGPHQVGRLGSPQKIAPSSTLDPKKAKKCLVGLLDGNEFTFLVNPDCMAEELLDEVCKYLQLTEKEYFGITYKVDKNENIPQAFLDLKKPLEKQLKKAIIPKLEFRVKFYPSDPTSLNETITKYLITCQVRMDIITGKLPVTFLTYCILGSYNAQADLGDFDPTRHQVPGYLRGMPFAPQNLQSAEMIEYIAALHSQHQGCEPERADYIYLDNARRLALYGLHLYDCKNSSEEDQRVGVFHGGFVVYRGSIRIQRYSWPKIIKFSYDKKKFILRRRPFDGESGDMDESFSFDSMENAKRFFKVMMDHHAFFRMREQQGPNRPKLNPRNPMFNPNTMRRTGEGDDDYYGASGGQDWSTLNTIARPGGRRPDADWGELPNISKGLSGSKGSLGPDTMNRTDTAALDQAARARMLEEQQRQQEEQRRQQEEQRRQQEEQRRQLEEQRRQQEQLEASRRAALLEEQQRQQEEQRRLQEQIEASRRAAQEQQDALQRQLAEQERIRAQMLEQQRQLDEERRQQQRQLEEQKRAQQMALEEQLRRTQAQMEEDRRQQMLQMEEQRREQQRQLEEEQRRRAEEARRVEEERRNAEELDRRRQAELEQQRQADENRKQLAQAAALGVDPSVVPFLTGLLRDIANQSQFKKETERHEMFTNQLPPPSRGSDGPEPASFSSSATSGSRKSGANQVSMWRLPPKQVTMLFKVQVGDPDEELGAALGSVLSALELDQTALVIGDVNLDNVECSLGPLPRPLPPPSASAVPGGPAADVRNSLRASALGDLSQQQQQHPSKMPPPPGNRAPRPPAPLPSSRGQTLV